MTVIATWLAVFVFEFVCGIPVVVENRLIPGFLLVAGCAVFSESVAMNVSYRMTIHATRRSIFVFLAEVARVASHSLVGKF
jgi:hypothetical protein